MIEPEPDEAYRARLLQIVPKRDRFHILLAGSPRLDAIGRKLKLVRKQSGNGLDTAKEN
jgi:hypothetical protein